MNDNGVTGVLHYVLPTHYVAEPKKDGRYDTRFDAVFDTRMMRQHGSIEQASFLDLGTPRVMIMGKQFLLLHKNLRDQLDAIVHACEHEEDEDILSWFKALGATFTKETGDDITIITLDDIERKGEDNGN
jgi:hypothetical protein